MRIKFEIEYDGTKFCGWQKQEELRTVQETVEEAISKVFNGKRFTLYGAGRTDTGVHALAQSAHVEILDINLVQKWEKNIKKMTFAINFYLHDTGVVIKSSEIVDDDFHARFSAKQRSYLYLILNRQTDSVLLKNRAWYVKKELDSGLMRDASQLFLGTHNFNAFRSADCQARNPVRTVDFISIEKRKDLILINIKAKSFLHNQVRIMVGTLKQIGCKKMGKMDIVNLFLSADRTKSGPTAPSYGLYFENVSYS